MSTAASRPACKELDDGAYAAWDMDDLQANYDVQKVHLRQGDCVVQNGTRHRWRNPLPEPCLMAFVSLTGKRG
jgi:hypothetical protein